MSMPAPVPLMLWAGLFPLGWWKTGLGYQSPFPVEGILWDGFVGCPGCPGRSVSRPFPLAGAYPRTGVEAITSVVPGIPTSYR